MAKRFIDTGLFDDEWFSELSSNAKLFWVYYLTKCDNAGLLKYNEKLMSFQTGIKDIPRVTQELGKRLLRVNEVLLFCPKFIEFQYPGFPKSKAPQQKGACDLLIKAGLMDLDLNFKSYLTLNQDLIKSYGNGDGNGIVFDNVVKEEKKEFEISEFEKTLNSFYEMRIKIKRPATNKAKDLILKELENQAGDNEQLKIDILNQSIINCWQGIFPLKKTQQSKDLSNLPFDPKFNP